jgi:hypothetical protein
MLTGGLNHGILPGDEFALCDAAGTSLVGYSPLSLSSVDTYTSVLNPPQSMPPHHPLHVRRSRYDQAHKYSVYIVHTSDGLAPAAHSASQLIDTLKGEMQALGIQVIDTPEDADIGVTLNAKLRTIEFSLRTRVLGFKTFKEPIPLHMIPWTSHKETAKLVQRVVEAGCTFLSRLRYVGPPSSDTNWPSDDTSPPSNNTDKNKMLANIDFLTDTGDNLIKENEVYLKQDDQACYTISILNSSPTPLHVCVAYFDTYTLDIGVSNPRVFGALLIGADTEHCRDL